jgi:hypothetical protein
MTLASSKVGAEEVTSTKLAPGPERTTPLERVIRLLPLRYPLGALLLALLAGAPGLFLSVLLDTANFGQTVSELFGYPAGGPASLLSLLGRAVWTFLVFYVFLASRFLRSRLVGAEPIVRAVAPEGEQTLHQVFARISRLGPPLVFGLIWLVPTLPALVGEFAGVHGAAELVFQVGSNALIFLGIGTVVHVYTAGLRGIHELGRRDLQLRPYYDDPMLGLRPLGALSLSFAFVYFLGIGLGGLATFLTPDPQFRSLQSLLVLLSLIVLGVVMFFLPLRSLHRRMVECCRQNELVLHREYARLVANRTGSDATALEEVRDLLAARLAERKVAATATWPLDVQILGRLAALVLSVTALMLARVLIVVLQL